MSETATKANGGTATKARTPKLMLATLGRLNKTFAAAIEKRAKVDEKITVEMERRTALDQEIAALGTSLGHFHEEFTAWTEANAGGKTPGGKGGAPPG